MVVERGSVWWVNSRPVLIVQADAFNRSRIDTIIAVGLTSNLGLLQAPGNVLVSAKASGLPRDSVADVSQLVTLAREDLEQQAGKLGAAAMKTISDGMRLVLQLA